MRGAGLPLAERGTDNGRSSSEGRWTPNERARLQERGLGKKEGMALGDGAHPEPEDRGGEGATHGRR
jgi:hypothetical protein